MLDANPEPVKCNKEWAVPGRWHPGGVFKQAKAVTMIKVKSRGNETVDQMLRRFKKLCEKEGLIKDMKRVSYYEKPSEKRRRRLRKAQSRQMKLALEGSIT